jgi:hypothetical protein
MMIRGRLCAGLWFLAASSAGLTLAGQEKTGSPAGGPAGQSGESTEKPGRSEEPTRLPEVTVTAPAVEEEAPVGENRQPEWTVHRRFSTTRVYVQPPWQIQFEQWWRAKLERDGHTSHLWQEEVEIGLPYRLQLDLYQNFERTERGKYRYQGSQAELRWALAEWGKIPLNPTLYGEWKFNDEAADAYELKLLLGEEWAPRWHWGFNASYEQETGGARATELALSQALSYTVVDRVLGVGVEMQLESTSEKGSRSDPAYEFLLGPSIQWRPIPQIHLDLVPLFGLTGDSPRLESFVVLGFDFGSGGREVEPPVSSRSR